MTKIKKTSKIKEAKKAFTLIEMLIVIVIIGILAAAIFPKLWWAQARARDVARKTNLQSVATALVTYQIDKWQYITTAGGLDALSWLLKTAGLDTIPSDPLKTRNLNGIGGATINSGQYGYTPIRKYWMPANAFVIMAAAETEWWANRSYIPDRNIAPEISSNTNYKDIKLCDEFIQVDSPANPCEYNKNNDQLRYIYRY